MTIDLDAYLQRIGWTGPLAPTFSTLERLAAKHTEAIAFENLDCFLGSPVNIDPVAVERKLVVEGRGGYCFEQNLLFSRALAALGYEVTGLAARGLITLPEEAITPRTHMLLRVELDGQTHVADVGFGGQTLTCALRLVADVEQPTPHEPYRLIVVDGDWRMQAKIRGEWRSLYRFDLQRQYAPDYEVANHYTSTHPRSYFVTCLAAARAAPGRRLVLLGRFFAVHHLGGETVSRKLGSAAEIRGVLTDELQIRLPDHPALDARLDALPG